MDQIRYLPENKEQWDILKAEFLSMPDIEDGPETWTFILSQLQNTVMPDLEFNIETVWAHYKRWKIAKVLQDEKIVYLMELQAKAEVKMKALALQGGGDEGISPSEHIEHLPDRTYPTQGDVPPLSGLKTGVVSDTP